MKRAISYTFYAFILLCILITSCNNITSTERDENELVTLSIATEQYYEGNLYYSLDASYFEESVSGEIIPVDMTGLPFMIETEYPLIKDKEGEFTSVKLMGYLAPLQNESNTPVMYLSINRIIEITEGKQEMQTMTGIYNGDGHTLTISSNHAYALLNKEGKLEEGRWFLHSRDVMVLLSENSKTIMKINYKKKSLNSREDHPTVFTFSTNISNH